MPKKIRALYITFNGIADPLGRAQVLPYLESLSKKGIKFYLISLEKDLKKSKEEERLLKDLDISWYKLKYFGGNFLFMAFNIFQCFLLSLYVVISKRIKTVHCRAYPSLFSVLLLKKLFSFKLIFDMRGFWPEGLVEIKRIKRGSISYKILKFLEKKSIQSSDYVITLTPEAKETIERIYKKGELKVVWMPTCVDKDRFGDRRPVFIKNKFVMVYSGSLWSYYDTPATVDFFLALKDKISNAHFLILANNGMEELRLLLEERGIKKDDYTILSVGSENVAEYLLGSDLAISFIRDLSFSKGSFPTKLSEYLICGLPVVANTQSSFIKDLINYNKVGVIVEKFDKNSYEEALEKISRLLKDKDIKNRCIKTADKYLEKNVCINKYVDIYGEME